MKKIHHLLRLGFCLGFLATASCKGNKENETITADDGADKSEVTQTGQHIGSTTDSTTVISDEPNPSND